MPVDSSYPHFDLPHTDLWTFMFERDKPFADDPVLYRDVVNPQRHYTYATVKEAARSFGVGLRTRLGLGKGDVVSIFAINDIDVVPCTYGVLYAGGVVSPANPAYSASDFAFMLKDAGVKLVITQLPLLSTAREAAKLAGLPQSSVLLLGRDLDSSSGAQHFEELCVADIKQDSGLASLDGVKDLAFLVYSSGTTGMPKGVMLNHQNIIADVLMISVGVGRAYNGKDDKLLGVLPFFHIYGLTGLVHQPLHRGIENVVMPTFSLPVFCQAVQDHKITFTYVAPPVIVQLSRDPAVSRYDLTSLRMITSGAAPLTRELVDTVFRKHKLKVNQAYGLSETSPMTHTQPWEDWYDSVGSVGKLFANMSAKYVDIDGNEAAAGKAGELWLKGPNVFQGYWKRPKETKDAFSEDGYFKTGDVGYQDEKHNFYITDRVKELIKYNGFQVAPAELEGLLMANDAVNDVAVIGIHDAEKHTELPRAYVVAAPGAKRDAQAAQQIVDWIDSRVAYYKKLRGGVRFIDQIPKSAAGKILRRVLKDEAKKEKTSTGPKL